MKSVYSIKHWKNLSRVWTREENLEIATCQRMIYDRIWNQCRQSEKVLLKSLGSIYSSPTHMRLVFGKRTVDPRCRFYLRGLYKSGVLPGR